MAHSAVAYAKALAPPPHDGLHHLDRARRHQHGDGRRRRARQPPAGAADPGRRLRQPPARSRAAAGRGFRRRHGLGQRLLPPGFALFRPHHPARADHAGARARACGADRPGRMRPRDARLLPGRAGRGLRLPRKLLRRAAAPVPPPCPGCGRTRRGRPPAARRQEAPDRRRRRRALCGRRGASSQPSPSGTAFPVPRPRPANPRCRTTIALAWARSASPAPAAANAMAAEADVVLAVGTRLADFTTGSAALFGTAQAIIGLNVQPFDAGQAPAPIRWWPTLRSASTALDGASGDWRAPAAWSERGAAAQGGMDRDGRDLHRSDQCRTAVRRPGDRRRAARARVPPTSWSARPAACRANCTSSGMPRQPLGYHAEYGYSTHGLRDRRRARGQDGAAGPRGLRACSATAPT